MGTRSVVTHVDSSSQQTKKQEHLAPCRTGHTCFCCKTSLPNKRESTFCCAAVMYIRRTTHSDVSTRRHLAERGDSTTPLCTPDVVGRIPKGVPSFAPPFVLKWSHADEDRCVSRAGTRPCNKNQPSEIQCTRRGSTGYDQNVTHAQAST